MKRKYEDINNFDDIVKKVDDVNNEINNKKIKISEIEEEINEINKENMIFKEIIDLSDLLKLYTSSHYKIYYYSTIILPKEGFELLYDISKNKEDIELKKWIDIIKQLLKEYNITIQESEYLSYEVNSGHITKENLKSGNYKMTLAEDYPVELFLKNEEKSIRVGLTSHYEDIYADFDVANDDVQDLKIDKDSETAFVSGCYHSKDFIALKK